MSLLDSANGQHRQHRASLPASSPQTTSHQKIESAPAPQLLTQATAKSWVGCCPAGCQLQTSSETRSSTGRCSGSGTGSFLWPPAIRWAAAQTKCCPRSPQQPALQMTATTQQPGSTDPQRSHTSQTQQAADLLQPVPANQQPLRFWTATETQEPVAAGGHWTSSCLRYLTPTQAGHLPSQCFFSKSVQQRPPFQLKVAPAPAAACGWG